MITENTEFNPKQPSSFNDSLQELDELEIHSTQSGLEHTIELYASPFAHLDNPVAKSPTRTVVFKSNCAIEVK